MYSKGFHSPKFHQILISFDFFLGHLSMACSKCALCGFAVFIVFQSFYEVFPIQYRNIEWNTVERISFARVSSTYDYFLDCYEQCKFCMVEMCNVRFLCFRSFFKFLWSFSNSISQHWITDSCQDFICHSFIKFWLFLRFLWAM